MDSRESPAEGSGANSPNTGEEEGSLVSPRSGRPIKKAKNDVKHGFMIPPSPPKFVTMDQLAEAANAFYNMSLAHEITVDSDFRIERYEPPEKSFERVVKETMHRAFWDLLRSSLEADPPDYEPALRLLAEVKESLSELILPHQKTLQKLIDSCLDLDVARSQLQETGHLSLEAYSEQVINVMKQFCAPVRDQEVEDLRKIMDPVEAFRHAFILLDKMHMDLANFTIAQMRPYIRQQAVTYERAKFVSFLEAQQKVGIDGLARARMWIKEAFNKLTSLSSSGENASKTRPDAASSVSAIPIAHPSGSGQTVETIPVTPNNILREAYLDLLTWPADRDWPETMVMDQQRLTDLGHQLTRIVTLTSLVLVVCNYIASNFSRLFANTNAISSHVDAMVTLKRSVCRAALVMMNMIQPEQLVQQADILAEEVVLTLERWRNSLRSSSTQNELATEPSTLPDDLRKVLLSQLSEVVHGRHPVYILMRTRATNFLRSALSSFPPETLPLPAGFSILLDVDDRKPVPSIMSPSGTAATQFGAPPSGLPTMATGVAGRSASSSDVPGNETEQTSSQKSTTAPESLSLASIASRLLPLLAHNRHVFGPHYAEIIQPLLIPTTNTTSSESSEADDTSSERRDNATIDAGFHRTSSY
ncbi:unnamed protein product [Calicophoron daubneyi]|uniref:T-complex 11 n=1 Tax=Calicophoron daubneyi TaxID=300641 RepID=A0AAV2TV77_CALDB